MSEDEELAAMSQISGALAKLDESARRRILQWLGDRYAMSPSSKSLALPASISALSDLASIFSAASPRTDAEKALVVAYWVQHVGGEKDFSSQNVNSELKQLGHKVSNITAALSSLMAAKPQSVIQVQKSGQTQQARKKYRITVQGIKRVQDMLSGTEDTE